MVYVKYLMFMKNYTKTLGDSQGTTKILPQYFHNTSTILQILPPSPSSPSWQMFSLLELLEPDIVGVLTETLSAQTESVLSNNSVLVGTNTTFTGTWSVRTGMREPHFAVNHSD